MRTGLTNSTAGYRTYVLYDALMMREFQVDVWPAFASAKPVDRSTRQPITFRSDQKKNSSVVTNHNEQKQNQTEKNDITIVYGSL